MTATSMPPESDAFEMGDLFGTPHTPPPPVRPIHTTASGPRPATVRPAATDFEPQVPRFNTEADVRVFLQTLVNHGFFDIRFQHEFPVHAERGGLACPVTTRPLNAADMDHLLPVLGDQGAQGRLAQFHVLDTSYSFVVDRSQRDHPIRFRVNITKAGTAFQISLRLSPNIVPVLGSARSPDDVALDVEPELISAIRLARGITLVTGKTNSGKTWLTAAAIDGWRTTIATAGAIITYERPVEIVHPINRPFGNPIIQHEVGRDVASWEQGLTSTTRRNPWAICIGEVNDRTTAAALLSAADQGPRAMATMHTCSVGGTVRRFTSFFDSADYQQSAHALLDLLSIVVCQFLVARKTAPGAPPSRHAIREWLVFTPQIKAILRASPPHEWPALLPALVREHGRSAVDSAQRAMDAGMIDAEAFADLQSRADT
jgi:defect-in-organelle-trafficking protein DotB